MVVDGDVAVVLLPLLGLLGSGTTGLFPGRAESPIRSLSIRSFTYQVLVFENDSHPSICSLTTRGIVHWLPVAMDCVVRAGQVISQFWSMASCKALPSHPKT